jgi:hypothetical protein
MSHQFVSFLALFALAFLLLAFAAAFDALVAISCAALASS